MSKWGPFLSRLEKIARDRVEFLQIYASSKKRPNKKNPYTHFFFFSLLSVKSSIFLFVFSLFIFFF